MSQHLVTRDDFEYWLADMDDALDRFLERLPAQMRQQLDYTAASLDTLESWVLTTYPSTQAMVERDQAQIVDGAARYIGETFRRAVGGRWDIDLKNRKNVFFGVPILTGFEERPTPVSPLALATASADRRTGTFLRTVLENIVRRVTRTGS